MSLSWNNDMAALFLCCPNKHKIPTLTFPPLVSDCKKQTICKRKQLTVKKLDHRNEIRSKGWKTTLISVSSYISVCVVCVSLKLNLIWAVRVKVCLCSFYQSRDPPIVSPRNTRTAIIKIEREICFCIWVGCDIKLRCLPFLCAEQHPQSLPHTSGKQIIKTLIMHIVSLYTHIYVGVEPTARKLVS